MSEHTVASFDADLKVLAGMIGEMGSRAGHVLADATKALLERNVQLAQQVIVADRQIDDLQHQIEESAVTTIAKRQPMAIDLREIISTMRIANDLERVGDLAKNVAKRVIAIGEQPSPVNVASGLSTLSVRVNEQLSQCLRAYRNRDEEAALAVWRADGAIDSLFTSLFRELLTDMTEDPRSIGFCTTRRSARRTWNVSATMPPISPRRRTSDHRRHLAAERPKADQLSAIADLRPPQSGGDPEDRCRCA